MALLSLILTIENIPSTDRILEPIKTVIDCGDGPIVNVRQ